MIGLMSARVFAIFSLVLVPLPQALGERRLRSAGSFNVADSLPREFRKETTQVHQFLCRSEALLFVLSDRSTAEDAILVRTDLYGRHIWARHLGAGTVLDMEADYDGKTYVALAGREDKTIVYDAAGEKVDEWSSRGVLKMLFSPRVGLVYAQHNGEVMQHGRSSERRVAAKLTPPSTKPDEPRSYRHLAVGDQKVVRIEGTSAIMDVTDVVTGGTYQIEIVSPYVDSARCHYRETIHDPGLRGVLIAAAAPSSTDETVNALVSAYRDSEGAVILHLDMAGHVLETYRCALPPRREGMGKILPARIGVTRNQLFIVGYDGTVGTYNLGEKEGPVR